MGVRIIPEDSMPNRVVRGSCHENLPEWKDVMLNIGTLVPGRGMVVELSNGSKALVGGSDKTKHTNFAKNLRSHFKNHEMHFTAYCKRDKVWVKRIK